MSRHTPHQRFVGLLFAVLMVGAISMLALWMAAAMYGAALRG